MGTQSQRRINLHSQLVVTSFRRHASAEEESALSLMRPSTNGKCLNDTCSRADLIRSLLGVLVRFRQGRSVSADIKEIFLQVKIKDEDRDSLRFLWRNNMNENPQ
ncbi:hypothetical protein EVAR_90788_1, partial [Eumeta japonica]